MAPVAQRRMASSAHKSPSLTQVWLGDKGAYPIMFILGFAVVGCSAFMTYKITQDPSVRVTQNHKNHVIRSF